MGKTLFEISIALMCVLSLAACDDAADGDDADADADTDTGTDADAGADSGAAPACPGLVEDVCADAAPVRTLTPLVTSAQLSVSAFVDFADLALLAWQDGPMKDGGGNAVIFAADGDVMNGEVPQWAQVELPDDALPLQPVALADGALADASSYRWTALLCEGGGTACSLWSASDADEDGTPELARIPGGEVPTGGELRGASFFGEWTAASGPAVCAFGDGVFCFDGAAWTTEIAAGTGPLFNDFTCDRNGNGICASYIAVGDGGRVATTSSGSESWFDRLEGTGGDLLAVSDAGNVIGGAGGELYGRGACAVSQAGVVGLAAEWYALPSETPPDTPWVVPIVGVTADRYLFFTNHQPDTGFGPLECGALAPDGAEDLGAVLGLRHVFCGIVPNLLVLTESALYGDWVCAID
jgi:hypothetical protein